MIEELELQINTENPDSLRELKIKYLTEIFSSYGITAWSHTKALGREKKYKEVSEKLRSHGLHKDMTLTGIRDNIENLLLDPERQERWKIILKSFLSPKYKAPIHEWKLPFRMKILDHLQCLLYYYIYHDRNMPPETTLFVDFAMTKIVHEATMGMWIIDSHGRDFDRIEEGVKKKRSKKAERKQYVLEIYYRTDQIAPSMKPHRIAKIIKDILEKEMKSSPSIDTIKRYLREEGLV